VSDITLPHAEKEGGEVMVGGGPAPGDDRTGGAARIWFTGSVLPRVGAATGPGGYLRSTLADEQHATFEARPHDLYASTEPAPSDGACMTVPAGWPPLALPVCPVARRRRGSRSRTRPGPGSACPRRTGQSICVCTLPNLSACSSSNVRVSAGAARLMRGPNAGRVTAVDRPPACSRARP
jgi:hypothetical protein